MRLKWSRRALLNGAAGLAVLLLGFWATYTGPMRVPLQRLFRSNRPAAYSPRHATVAGPQLVMIYFGSAHCGWSNDRAIPGLVERIELTALQRADSLGWSFEAIGVAVDWVPREGLEHLRKTGEFDEVAAGANWANALVMKYFGERQPDPVATPQVLVVRRNVVKPTSAEGTFNYSAHNEQVLVRKLGVFELQRWVEDGVPIPGLPASRSVVSARATPRGDTRRTKAAQARLQ